MSRKPILRIDRNHNGTFAPGNPGGPGNPYAHRVAVLRRAMFDVITEDDVKTIFAKLVEMAKEGDLAAIKEVLVRVDGKAPEHVSPDRIALDAAEIEAAKLEARRRKWKAQPDDIEKLLGSGGEEG